MNDDQTMILIESINLNPNLSSCTKLDLIRKTMSDCREKQIGKIIVDAIEKKSIEERPVKRKRGRPRKELSDNARNMILHSRNIDRNNGVGHE